MQGGNRLVVGKGCLECFKTWSSARQKDGDFNEVMAMCEDDMDYQNKFMEDGQIRQGLIAKDFHEQGVSEIRISGVKAFKSLIGYTEQQFKDKFGVFPKDVGLKMADLVSETGNGCRCVLCVDPARPETRYEVAYDVHRRLEEHRMLAKDHLHRGQGEKVFDLVVGEANEPGKFAQRCRSCALTTDGILALVEENAKAGLGRGSSATGSAAEGEDDGDGMVQSHLMARAPTLRAASVRLGKRRAGGIGSAHAWGVPPPRSSRPRAAAEARSPSAPTRRRRARSASSRPRTTSTTWTSTSCSMESLS